MDQDPLSATAMRMYTYLDRKGREQGPFPMQMLVKWKEKGYFDGNLWVKEEGREEWCTLQDELEQPTEDMEVVEVLEKHRHAPIWMLNDDAQPMEGVTLEVDIGEAREHAPMVASSPEVPLVCIVLDTNVVLTHLSFVQSLKDRYAPHCQVLVVVPWIVVCELDGLKSSRRGDGTGSRVADLARQAIRHLKQVAMRPDGFTFVQTMSEFRDAAKKLQKFSVGSHVNNDDRILQCCIHYQQKMNEGGTQNQGADFGAGVVLLSNDANLCVKAIANGVSACSTKDFPSGAEELMHEAENTATGVEAPTPLEEEDCPTFTSTDAIKSTDWYELINEAVTVFEDVYNDVCLAQFERAMGDLWEDVIDTKPPWKGKDIASYIRRHWNAVFRDVMPPSLLQQVDVLEQIMRKIAKSNAVEGFDTLKCIDAVEHLVLKAPTERLNPGLAAQGRAKVLKLHVVALLLVVPTSQKRLKVQSQEWKDPLMAWLLQDLELGFICPNANGRITAGEGFQAIQKLSDALTYRISVLYGGDSHAPAHGQHLGSSQPFRVLISSLDALSDGISDACKVLRQSDATAKDFERAFHKLSISLNVILTNITSSAMHVAPHEFFLSVTSSSASMDHLNHCKDCISQTIRLLQELEG